MERDVLSCLLRSSKLKDELSPVVDVSRALVPTSSVADGSKLIPSVKPFKRIGSVIARPSRGRYPWLAKVLTMGHGLRPDQKEVSKRAFFGFEAPLLILCEIPVETGEPADIEKCTHDQLMTVLARDSHHQP